MERLGSLPPSSERNTLGEGVFPVIHSRNALLLLTKAQPFQRYKAVTKQQLLQSCYKPTLRSGTNARAAARISPPTLPGILVSHRLVSPPLARTVSSQTGSHHMQMSHSTLIALVTCAQVFRGNIRPAPGFQCSRSSWYYLASSSRQHVPAQSTSRIGSTTQRLPPTLCGNSARLR